MTATDLMIEAAATKMAELDGEIFEETGAVEAYIDDAKAILNAALAAMPSAQPAAQPVTVPVTLTYTNWRGETAERTIIPRSVWFGSTDWHPEPQWLLKAIDTEKGAERDFALKDFGAPPADAQAAQPVAVPDGAIYMVSALVEKAPNVLGHRAYVGRGESQAEVVGIALEKFQVDGYRVTSYDVTECTSLDQPSAQPVAVSVTLTYTNWRGETAERTIIPRSVWFGSTDWHPESQWLLKAIDTEKGVERDFALKDFGTRPAAQPVAVPEGWVLVPVEPTEEMLQAGEEARRENTTLYMDGSEVAAGDLPVPIYRDMLAAAPTPPADAIESAILALEEVHDFASTTSYSQDQISIAIDVLKSCALLKGRTDV